MSLKQDIPELLYRSFDGPLDEKEQETLAKALRNSPALREEKRQIEMQRQAVSVSGEEFSFEPFFAERVMNRLTADEKPERVAPAAHAVTKRYSSQEKSSQENNFLAHSNIEQYGEIFFNSLFALFKRVALIGAAACIIVIAYNLAKGENLKADDALFVSQATYEEMLDLPLF